MNRQTGLIIIGILIAEYKQAKWSNLDMCPGKMVKLRYVSELRYVYKQDAYPIYLATIAVSRLDQTRESRRCKEIGKKGVWLRYLRKIVFLYYLAGLHKEI